jgi:hypothetical protein
MLAVARIIWETVYATLATPAVWPRRLHHPIIQDQIAACSGGTTFFVTKYIPPAVGYAETSSATTTVRYWDKGTSEASNTRGGNA